MARWGWACMVPWSRLSKSGVSGTTNNGGCGRLDVPAPPRRVLAKRAEPRRSIAERCATCAGCCHRGPHKRLRTSFRGRCLQLRRDADSGAGDVVGARLGTYSASNEGTCFDRTRWRPRLRLACRRRPLWRGGEEGVGKGVKRTMVKTGKIVCKSSQGGVLGG